MGEKLKGEEHGERKATILGKRSTKELHRGLRP
jgi:hypothetical protein